MERTATHYSAATGSQPCSMIFQLGRWLWCDFTVKFLRRLPFLWQGHSFPWQSLQGFDFEILFSSCNLQWLLCWPLFTFEIALTLTAIISRLMCLGFGFRWHAVMFEKICAIASEDSIAGSRRQARNYKQWAGAWSILDILLRNTNSIILHMMNAFGAVCYSRIQANVSWLTLSILMLV